MKKIFLPLVAIALMGTVSSGAFAADEAAARAINSRCPPGQTFVAGKGCVTDKNSAARLETTAPSVPGVITPLNVPDAPAPTEHAITTRCPPGFDFITGKGCAPGKAGTQ